MKIKNKLYQIVNNNNLLRLIKLLIKIQKSQLKKILLINSSSIYNLLNKNNNKIFLIQKNLIKSNKKWVLKQNKL